MNATLFSLNVSIEQFCKDFRKNQIKSDGKSLYCYYNEDKNNPLDNEDDLVDFLKRHELEIYFSHPYFEKNYPENLDLSTIQKWLNISDAYMQIKAKQDTTDWEELWNKLIELKTNY